MLQAKSIFHSPFPVLSSPFCIFCVPALFMLGCGGYWSFVTLAANMVSKKSPFNPLWKEAGLGFFCFVLFFLF